MENTNVRITAVNLTRAGLIASGVLGIVLTAFAMLPSFGEYVTHAAMNYQRGILAPLIASALAPAITLGICWYLITGSDSIAQRLFPDESPDSTQTERAIYRVVFTSMGILMLVSTFPSFIHAIGNTFVENAESNLWPDDFYNQFTFYNLPYIVAFIVQFALAIYLIIGAPRLIRWQTSRNSDAG